jgi:flavorubredoxin
MVSKIADDVITFRGYCTSRLKFEIEYGMKHGTTENSYLIKAESGYVLIDLPDQAFSQAFAQVVADTIDLKSLKYLILGHLSPKRVDSLINLLQALPDQASPLQIYCSNPAAQLLSKSFSESPSPKPFSVKSVRAGDRIDLGGGHELHFFLTPTPRWPDALCTYDSATQLLFTQKIFSAHVSGSGVYDVGGWDVYGEDWRYYYDCMLAPTPVQIKATLDKLQVVQRYAKPNYRGKTGLEVLKADMMYIASSVLGALNLPVTKSPLLKNFGTEEGAVVTAAICPLHGPIVRTSITELVREYGEWTEGKLKQLSDATVAVIYASAYGMTATLAQAIR